MPGRRGGLCPTVEKNRLSGDILSPDGKGHPTRPTPARRFEGKPGFDSLFLAEHSHIPAQPGVRPTRAAVS